MKAIWFTFLFGYQLFFQMHEALNLSAKIPMPNTVVQTGNSLQTGTVKFYSTDKHFGFITPDDGGQDLFFHISQINASIYEIFNNITDYTRVSFVKGSSNDSNTRVAAMAFNVTLL